MKMLDDHGRLFGRLNLFDAVVMAFLVGLIPLGYASYLLFRPAAPTIESVTRVPFSREEERVTAGAVLAAKLKVVGSNFNPLLRAEVGGQPALGFVFESPNSADVLVGLLPPGTHDLALFDGIQEVARAPGVFEYEPVKGAAIRVVGRFIRMRPDTATSLREGMTLPETDAVVVHLGPVKPNRLRVNLRDGATDLPADDRVERGAVVDVWCSFDGPLDRCTVAGRVLAGDSPVNLAWPGTSGPLVFRVEEILPATVPRPARLRVRLAGGSELEHVRVGDRDRLLDARRAEVVGLEPRAASGATRTVVATLTAGLDESGDGWRYRGRLVQPGAPFVLSTDRYVVQGVIEDVSAAPGEAVHP